MTVKVIETKNNPAQCKVTMTLEVTGQSKAAVVKEALLSFAAEQGIEGGQGMAAQTLRDKLAQQTGADAVDRRVTGFFAARVGLPLAREHGLDLMFAPESAKPVLEGLYDKSAIACAIDFICRPQLTLSSYAPVSIQDSPALVTDAMVDAQLAREMARFAVYEECNGPLEEGQVAVVNMQTKADGVLEPGLSGEGLRLVLAKGQLPDALVDNVVGMEVGQRKAFAFTATERGSVTPVTFEVDLTVTESRRRLVPELTDEFVRTRLSAEDTTVEQFRKRVRAFLARGLRDQAAARREELVDAELGSRLQGTVPDCLIERTRDQMMDSIVQTATAQGLTLAQLAAQQGTTQDRFAMEVAMQARASLRQGLALDALFDHLQLPLTDADYAAALTELAPGDEAAAKERFQRNDAWYLVEQMARRLKAHRWAVQTAS